MHVLDFFYAWIFPREVFKKIASKNVNAYLLVFSTIAGFLILCNFFQIYQMGLKLSFPFLTAALLLLSPLAGYLYLSVYSLLLFITGKWIEGKGSYKKIRLAVGFSTAPLIGSCLIWLALYTIFQNTLFSNFPGSMILSPTMTYVLLTITLMQMGFYLWSMILYLSVLSEVQTFSMAKAVMNSLFAFGLIISILLMMWLVAIFIWAHYI